MKKLLVFTGLLTVLLAPGCKKEYLETAPTNQVAFEDVFSSTTNANAVINGIYAYMFTRTTATTSNAQGKPGVAGILLGIDFMGEDLHQANLTWFTNTGEGTYVAARTDSHASNLYYYRTFYRIINNANYVLENIDAAQGLDADKNRIKAEAYTLRAYAYSYLVQFYGTRYDATAKPNKQLAVPLVLTVADVAKPRVSVEEIYTQIVSDLDKAIALNLTTKVNKTHADVWVSKGLRARVALTMQDYPNAIKYAKEVIDGGKYPLMSQSDYQTGFNNNSLSEFMWCAMPTTEQGDTFGSFYAQIAYNANTSYMRGTPKMINSALYKQISATDVRKKMWEPIPTPTNFPLPTTSFKRVGYMSRKFSVKTVGDPSLGDVPWMRSAEMHLILAEAYARSNQDALAQTALFALVSKRDLSAVKSTKTGSNLIDEIMMHRRVELWGEGFRYLDLKRLNQGLDRTTVPNFVPNSVNNVMQIPAGDPRFLFLIPRDEINANPNIGPQNP
ncbi:RagB/SusD family nutrient uptake outer membrane protein [Pedobacter endophyticus]|uniref:RagB/SusD family nutrient uptake outer membrane protein n=1 Tax=Pedobacter endophyticus TaxID=2789740 RepID=A0A7U3SP01_9SPHI|nr:RagB/SusD family nutrient uptake outer membrane protein [Pedobacter endophyticus]QPH37913.1 RagB/SusD family nutrient uptake outer membrane protein [Pedobacter endophyticus]